MSRTISLRDANQTFARCVREVEADAEYTITRNGVPVAKLVQHAALARTQAHMAQGWPIGAGSIDRAALHER